METPWGTSCKRRTGILLSLVRLASAEGQSPVAHAPVQSLPPGLRRLKSRVCCAEVVLSSTGTYQVVNSQSNPGAHVTLQCIDTRTTPFIINFNGNTFQLTVRHQTAALPSVPLVLLLDSVMHVPHPRCSVQDAVTSAFVLSYCTNVELYGGTWEYIKPQRPVAQGTITAINGATDTWTVQVLYQDACSWHGL